MRPAARTSLSISMALSFALAPADEETGAGSATEDPVGARIEAIRKDAGLPALGAALVTLKGVEGLWVAGTRRAGAEEPVANGDAWHLGSCTKSMTATLIALLVTRGDLAWETTLAEALPELAQDGMHSAYHDVTLIELLSHRAGLAKDTNPVLFLELRTSREPLAAQRAKMARAVLSREPAHQPHGEHVYANDGYVIAGHLAERATGKEWEELMRELLFEPLGMKSAGFGAPGSAATVDAPRGHSAKGKPIEPGPIADNPAALGPAGTVHASLADWAKYVRLHLAGARGDVEVGELTLTADAFALLHRPTEGPGQGYALGWVVEQRAWAGGDGTALWHNGSNTLWYCVTWLGLEKGVAALVVTNQASAKAPGATDEVASLLIREFQRRTERAESR